MKKLIALMLALLTLMTLLTGCKEEQLPSEDPTGDDLPPIVVPNDPTGGSTGGSTGTTEPSTGGSTGTTEPSTGTTEPTTPVDPKPSTGDTVTFVAVKEIVYSTTVVNVRTKPTTEGSEVLGKLTAGQGITRTGIGSNGWDEVNYKGETAYIKSEYLTTTKPQVTVPDPEPTVGKFTDVNETVYVKTSGGSLRVRSLPSTDGSILGSLANGASVIRTGVGENGWSRITFEGATAYVSTDYLTTTAP